MKMENNLLAERLTEVEEKAKAAAGDANTQRNLFKSGFSFSRLPFDEQILTWDYIWINTSKFRARLQAFLFCESLIKKDNELMMLWPVIKKWQDQVNCWEFSDCLSKIYSKILEIDPEVVYPVLADWNKSKNPWKQRQSIVSLMYYSSVRKSILSFEKQVILVRNLLTVNDYYVQKGVGWTLRELGNVYPDETWDFLLENINLIYFGAFGTATEKLGKDKKEQLKLARKKNCNN